MVILPSGRRHHGLRRGLVSFWPLNEASGTRVDVHGSNDLTDNNTVAQGTGNVYANCADLERGNTEYLSVANNSTLNPSEITFCCWVQIEASFTQLNIAAKDDYSSNSTREFLLDYESTANRFRAYVFYNATGGFDLLDADNFGAPSTATWYFICLKMGSTLSLSVNAGTADTMTASGSRNIASTQFAIGAQFNGATPVATWDGLMGPAMFYNRILTDAEVAALYNGGSGLKYDQF